ncbi:hypothetical protein K16_23700 [Klebsiella pneumoniae]|nr:hypothetical protein K16_23700 [Klebsiella pneumoniae]
MDPQDIQAFRELDKLGVKLDLRVVASDPSVNILDKINETAFCEKIAPVVICRSRQDDSHLKGHKLWKLVPYR